MLQSRLLAQIIAFMQLHEMAYMVTGSVVSSLQSEPRATHDIDLVVLLKQADIGK
jgi:hypothetical protein